MDQTVPIPSDIIKFLNVVHADWPRPPMRWNTRVTDLSHFDPEDRPLRAGSALKAHLALADRCRAHLTKAADTRAERHNLVRDRKDSSQQIPAVPVP